ncbi:nectin-2-like [Notechis scutatus]|uniref:Nectin-2-like n=1 Tax=Notechis scutatus TaxID=8663 RepID=A0A6J1W3S5_9SAUR|nr:nectin-2-like [Notechis scutatus]
MNNKVFYQHPNLMRALGMHETVMEVMVNVLGGGDSKEIRFPKMVTNCCRFLCYFCRISRQNQRSMFDHLSYLLQNSGIGLGFPRSSGRLPKSVEVQGQRLHVKRVDHTVNTTFICQATNRVGQVSTQQIILVRDQPVKSQSRNVGALVGGIVGGILALALLGIIVFFILHRRHLRAPKGSFDPKARALGNGTAQPPTHDFTELDQPLKPAMGRKPEEDEEDDYREEVTREERRHPPYGYAPRHREDEEERFDQLGPILRFSPNPHGYEYDDMESQHDGSIISKTAVYV